MRRWLRDLVTDAWLVARLVLRHPHCPHAGGHGPCLPLCDDLPSFPGGMTPREVREHMTCHADKDTCDWTGCPFQSVPAEPEKCFLFGGAP